MEYITTKQAAVKWKITSNRVFILARNGQIPGSIQIGSRWLIPETAEKPLDGRTRTGKIKENTNFRYPDFAYKDVSSFFPPLNSEELQLKRVTEEFLACNFEKADEILGELPEKGKNRYIRIYALYTSCMIDICLLHIKRFFDRYTKLSLLLQENFPRKKEMSFLLHEIDAVLGYNKYFADEFTIDTFYDYHPSFLPHLNELYIVSLYYSSEKANTVDIKGAETICKALENTDNYFDLQSAYVFLGSTYAILGETDKTTYYFKKALDIALKHNCFYCIISQYFYMKQLFRPALKDFPAEFVEKIELLSDTTHKTFVKFSDAISSNSIYKLLPSKYYIYIFYAVTGYTNKEVADLLHISESSVSREYSELYSLTNVRNKSELTELYKSSVNTPTTGK